MRFSVVIPCHNAGPWIGIALKSVAAQVYAPHEIIVIDDASSDDSIAQIKASGIDAKVLQTQRAYGAGARNVGIKAATGDWIALLDADDVWYPNHLARASELLNGSSDVAFMANHDWIDLQGAVIPIPDPFQCKLKEPQTHLPHSAFFEISSKGFHFGHSSVIYNRDRLMEVGCFDETQRRRHDLDLWLRTIHNHTWTYDTIKQMGYRENTPNSISREVVNCEYFYLRALLRNRPGYEGEHMRHLITTSARRAMSLAFVDGTSNDFTLARSLAWDELSGLYRAFYRAASVCPPLFRQVLKVKRRRFMASQQKAAEESAREAAAPSPPKSHKTTR